MTIHARTRSNRELPRRPGPRSRRGTLVAVPLALGALALTAACGASGGTASAAPSTSNGSGPVASASTDLGTILVDGRGRTVYEFANDTGTRSTCDGACAQEWPPVMAPDALPTSLPGVSGELGTTTRGDGGTQLTIAGHPVYTFSGDGAPGQTNGQGINLNGGVWNVVTTAGSPVQAGSSAPATY
jgi:predicted lipoprotein with Yx(FWY)xxD motif